MARAKRYSKYALGGGVVEDVVSGVMSHARSKPIHVTVFPRVMLLPERLLLIPGGEYTIRIVGGPPKGLWKPVYSLQDEKIADIDENGVVRGKIIGKTGYSMQMNYALPREEIILTKEERAHFRELEHGALQRVSTIEVALATGLLLPALAGRNIKLDTVVRPVVELKRGIDTFNF